MGGNARWMAAVITMDGGSKIAMDGGSCERQQQHNGWWNSKAITMGVGTATATTVTMTQKLAAAVAMVTMTMTADSVGGMATTR
jgi:hypothetical protein